jgi:hypothetical protein
MGARRKKSRKPSATKAEQLLEQTTFYVDYCLGRYVSEALRASGLKVEFHLDHFAEDTPDKVWLAFVGQKGWVALTKDKGIRRKAWEREKVLSAKVGLFTLPSGNMTGEEMAEMYRSNRLRMARFLRAHPPPFIAVVHRDTIDLLEPRVASEESATD